MNMYTMEREIEYEGKVYRIIEALRSDTLLVVLKDDYDNKTFPLQTYVIPGR